MMKGIVHLSGLLLCLSLNLFPNFLSAKADLSCGTTISSFPYTESFESGLGAWSDAGPAFRWYRNSGITSSTNTGPSSAYQGTYYMYVEASGSGGFPQKEMNLEGPCFDLSSASTADFEFAYHMYGAYMGSLSLQISNDNGANWVTLWSKTNDQGNQWFIETVELDAFVGQTIQLRFHGITGASWSSDMAIDDLSLTINSTPNFSCSSPVSTFPYTEGFESGLNTWTSQIGSASWSQNSGGTTSFNTGPSSADEGSFYAYVESSSPYNPNKNAIIESPCFDLSQISQASFHFSYHMYGASMGDLKLLIQTENDLSWQTIWSRSNDRGNQWFTANVDLGAFVGQKVKLRFEGITGSSYQSDMAVDDFSLTATSVNVSAGCQSTITSFPYLESFESGLGGWYEQAAVSLWNRITGATPSNFGPVVGTGPISAQSGSYYVYSEGDAITASNTTAYLTGPCFDLSTAASANFTFQYHMYSYPIAFNASLSLQVSTNQGASWNNIWSKVGLQGQWQAAEVDLSAYVGQQIQLRFESQHVFGVNNDIGIDNIQLYAPQTPLGGNVQASVQFPQTTSCSDPGENYCCDASTITGLAIPNVGVNMVGVSGSTVNAVTNGTGTFGETLPGGEITLNPFVNNSDWDNGISISDVIIVNNHASGNKLINCPLQRLAADVDNDGDIDSDDGTLINNMNVGSITTFPGGDNWRFIPKASIMPTDIHPDGRFTADFWNTAKEDASGDAYPFKAKLQMANGSSYTYSGSNSWLNSLESTLNTNCSTTDFGFYAVKVGDINGTAVYNNFADPYGAPAAASEEQLAAANDPNQIRQEAIRQQQFETDLRSGRMNKYEVKIIVESEIPIVGYQMGLRYDDEVMNLGKIKPNQDYLKQSEAKNFGQARKGLRGGVLKTQWITDFKTEPRGKVLNSTITVMAFEFQSKEPIEVIKSAFYLDNSVSDIQFYGPEGLLESVDLQVFVEAIK